MLIAPKNTKINSNNQDRDNQKSPIQISQNSFTSIEENPYSEFESLQARIIVCGVGGAGCNAVNAMVASGEIQGVEFLAVNTDAQVLKNSLARPINIGRELTKGLGAGSNPIIGKQAAEDSVDVLNAALAGADMVFITAGMGGGTGTGAAPVIAGIAKGNGALTIGVVTKPFRFEGERKMEIALKGIEELKSKVDALIVIPNERILSIIDRSVSYRDAMKKSDEVLKNAIQSISDIITKVGYMNVDFADVKAIMQNAGTTLMGIGHSNSKESKTIEATKMAIQSPILDYSIDGATGVILIIRSNPDISMIEVSEAAEYVKGYVDPNALIKTGVIIDENLSDTVYVTVLATGFNVDPTTHQLGDRPNSFFDIGTQSIPNSTLHSHSNNLMKQSTSNHDIQDDEDLDSTPAFLRRRNPQNF